jgi:hypothetical protein
MMTLEASFSKYKIYEFICLILGLFIISVGMFVNLFYRNYYILMLFCIMANLYVFMCIYIKSHKSCEKCELLYCVCKPTLRATSEGGVAFRDRGIFCLKLKPSKYNRQIDEIPEP